MKPTATPRVTPRSLLPLLSLLSLLAGATAHAGPHVLSNPRLSVTFGSTAQGFTAADNDRVDAISWMASDGSSRTNYVAFGGPLHCGDPQEFFGQSYGEPEGTQPYAIYAGSQSTWTGTTPAKGKTKTLNKFCADLFPPDVLPVTTYAIATAASQVNEMQVVRTFPFGAATPVFSGHGIRPFVARVPLSAYPKVLVPDAAGTAINSFDAGGCGGDCEVTDWNGRWFADDNGSGYGLMVIRSASSTAPALLTINNDAFSASNLSSVVLIQPGGGWKSPVTEGEYLCFYDPVTWTTAMRAALQLPKGCAGTRP